jgi:hypothetical protein
MPGGFWGLLSPRLTLWAGVDDLRLYSPSGDSVALDAAGSYRRGDVVEPRGLSKALVAGYRALMHRSYGLAPFVQALIAPGATPAGLFVWDAVLRTSGASGWLIEDAGLACLQLLGSVSQQPMHAAIFLFKSCMAWQIVRNSRKALEVATCGRVSTGSADPAAASLPALLEVSAKEAVSRAAARMVEDEVALLTGAPITVFIEAVPAEIQALAQACADTLCTVLGGGGGVSFVPLPSPEAVLGIDASGGGAAGGVAL